MLTVVIPFRDYESAKSQIQSVLYAAEAVELRLDYAENLNFNEVAKIRNEFTLAMIFTLRKKTQGGFYPHDEATRLQSILTLCELNPNYFDLEYDVPYEFLEKIKIHFPNIKLICSYHNFLETPEDLLGILESMQSHFFDAYKIATLANTHADTLRMLEFILSQSKKTKFTGIGMGEEGKLTRILSQRAGNMLTYVCADNSQPAAPGQLTVKQFFNFLAQRTVNFPR